MGSLWGPSQLGSFWGEQVPTVNWTYFQQNEPERYMSCLSSHWVRRSDRKLGGSQHGEPPNTEARRHPHHGVSDLSMPTWLRELAVLTHFFLESPLWLTLRRVEHCRISIFTKETQGCSVVLLLFGNSKRESKDLKKGPHEKINLLMFSSLASRPVEV